MLGVQKHPIPHGTALSVIAQKPGFYTDCFATEINDTIALGRYVEAFYTTPLFKVERLVLRGFGLRSSDLDARNLARGDSDRFAAWHVTERTGTQLLMKAIGRTSSWFMVEHIGSAAAPKTRLLFGSVVAPKHVAQEQTLKLGAMFSVLHGLHILYSNLLLASARRRLEKSTS